MGSLTEKLHSKLLTIDILNEGGGAPEQTTATIDLPDLRLIVCTLADFDQLRSRVRELERIKTEWERANAETQAWAQKLLQNYD